MNRDLSREAFERWYNAEYVRPIIPADRTEGGYQHPDAQAAWDAWQAALSHAEVEAVEPADTQILEIAQNPMVTPCLPWWLKDDVNAGDVQTAAIAFARAVLRKFGSYPAPQVAVPEAITKYDGYVPPEDGSAGEYYVDGWNSCRDAILANSAPAQTVSASVPEQKTWNQAGGREDLRYTEGWNDCRAAMLAAAPTAPAGEFQPDAEAAMAAIGEQPVSDPDGLPDRVLMPRALTAKNGAKTALMGEFTFSVTMTCPECHPDDPNPDCEVCSGSVEYEQPHTVPWTTIKRIYSAAVDLLSAPSPDEREIAALALERHADNLIVMAERDGRNNDRESQQTWEEAAYFAKQEAARLRAGKEGE